MPAGLPVGALLLSLVVSTGAARAHDEHRKLSVAPRPDGYAFVPEPGTYRLPPIRKAGSGAVLDEHGTGHDLAHLLVGQITVIAFIYTRCADACPAATLQLSLLQDAAAREQNLPGRMRLVSMSFDPDHDRPEVMAQHAWQWRSADRRAPEWLFLTAPDQRSLAPILTAYNQTVSPKPDKESAAGPLTHVFRAFLVDREARIRNIYSLDFLEPRLVLNDVRTLLIEDARATQARSPLPDYGRE